MEGLSSPVRAGSLWSKLESGGQLPPCYCHRPQPCLGIYNQLQRLLLTLVSPSSSQMHLTTNACFEKHLFHTAQKCEETLTRPVS